MNTALLIAVAGSPVAVEPSASWGQTRTASVSVEALRPVEDPDQRVPVTFDRALPTRARLTESGDIITEAPPRPSSSGGGFGPP